MTVPLELRLISTADGPRLTFTPAKELAKLRAKTHRVKAGTLTPASSNPLAQVNAELVELRAEFTPAAGSEVSFNVRGCAIAYNAKSQELTVNGHRAPAPLRNGKQRLTIYCDRTGLEVFASDGLCYIPMPLQPKVSDLTLGAAVTSGEVKLSKLEAYELKSAWPTR